MRFANDFRLWLRHSWKSLANHLTRDQKSLFTVTHALFLISCIVNTMAADDLSKHNNVSTIILASASEGEVLC